MEDAAYTPVQAEAIRCIGGNVDEIKAFEAGQTDSLEWLDTLLNSREVLSGSYECGAYALEEAKFMTPQEMGPDIARAWYISTLNLLEFLRKYGSDEVRGHLEQGKFVGVIEYMRSLV